MTRKTMAAAVLVAALAAIPVVAHQEQGGQGGGFGPAGQQGRGGRGPGGPGGPGGPNIMAMVRQLDLSDAQKEQLKGILEDRREAGDPAKTGREAEQKLSQAIFGETAHAAALETAKAAIAAAHAAELERRVETMQKVAQILTPAQRQQLLTLRPEGRGRGRHH
jgi:Spy/CpxP family protein refolding chaperone